MQNELLSLMAQLVLSKITEEVRKACHYTLIVDETKDVSKREQISLVLHYVHEGNIYERFISYSHAQKLNASAITDYILNALTDLKLNISDCISQCYDDASVMSGCCSGVKTRILEKNPKAIHQLNLVLVDTCKQLSAAFDFFALLESLYVFMSSSIPHNTFISKQSELGLSREIRLKQLSDTRWSCRYASIKAVNA